MEGIAYFLVVLAAGAADIFALPAGIIAGAVAKSPKGFLLAWIIACLAVELIHLPGRLEMARVLDLTQEQVAFGMITQSIAIGILAGLVRVFVRVRRGVWWPELVGLPSRGA